MENLSVTWHEFIGTLKLYGNSVSCLNRPCPPDKVPSIESALGLRLPPDLVELLSMNNGQALDSTGIFKSISGWDVYRRHVLLDIESIAVAYETFVRDEVLFHEFGDKEIPFSVDHQPSAYSEVFSINQETQKVSLIWTDYIDPFNPPEWQVAKFDRGENLNEFIKQQIKFYR